MKIRAVDRIVLKPYDSFRGAWADMLRGKVDMLYEVGLEGLDSLQPELVSGALTPLKTLTGWSDARWY